MWQLSLIQYLLFSENSHLRREIHTGARVILAKASRGLIRKLSRSNLIPPAEPNGRRLFTGGLVNHVSKTIHVPDQ